MTWLNPQAMSKYSINVFFLLKFLSEEARNFNFSNKFHKKEKQGEELKRGQVWNCWIQSG